MKNGFRLGNSLRRLPGALQILGDNFADSRAVDGAVTDSEIGSWAPTNLMERDPREPDDSTRGR